MAQQQPPPPPRTRIIETRVTKLLSHKEAPYSEGIVPETWQQTSVPDLNVMVDHGKIPLIKEPIGKGISGGIRDGWAVAKTAIDISGPVGQFVNHLIDTKQLTHASVAVLQDPVDRGDAGVYNRRVLEFSLTDGTRAKEKEAKMLVCHSSTGEPQNVPVMVYTGEIITTPSDGVAAAAAADQPAPSPAASSATAAVITPPANNSIVSTNAAIVPPTLRTPVAATPPQQSTPPTLDPKSAEKPQSTPQAAPAVVVSTPPLQQQQQEMSANPTTGGAMQQGGAPAGQPAQQQQATAQPTPTKDAVAADQQQKKTSEFAPEKRKTPTDDTAADQADEAQQDKKKLQPPAKKPTTEKKPTDEQQQKKAPAGQKESQPTEDVDMPDEDVTSVLENLLQRPGKESKALKSLMDHIQRSTDQRFSAVEAELKKAHERAEQAEQKTATIEKERNEEKARLAQEEKQRRDERSAKIGSTYADLVKRIGLEASKESPSLFAELAQDQKYAPLMSEFGRVIEAYDAYLKESPKPQTTAIDWSKWGMKGSTAVSSRPTEQVVYAHSSAGETDTKKPAEQPKTAPAPVKPAEALPSALFGNIPLMSRSDFLKVTSSQTKETPEQIEARRQRFAESMKKTK